MGAVMKQIQVRKHQEYKDSGISWLGSIPSHWNLLSNKNIFKLKKKHVGKKSGDYVLLSLTLNGVIKRDMENPQGKFPAEFNTYQEVKKGDFIFCLFDVEETPRCVGLSDFDGMITGAYTVMEPHEQYDKKFLYYFYLNLDSDKRLKPLYTGLRNTISKENFFSFKTFVPPLNEQKAIANFLDRKTALIDQAIDIKQKQIELLKERRQILIHKAVTRGLNVNVKMKDSGVEWIGEIPEHWEIKRLKELCKAFGRIGFRGYTTSDLVGEGEGAITISPSNIKDEYMTFEKCSYLSWNKYDESPEIQIYENDILIVKTGSTFGKTGIVKNLPEKATINPQLLVLKDIQIDPDYFYALLKTSIVQSQVQTEVIGSTIPTISETKILNFKVAIPTPKEIDAINTYNKNVNEKLATAISLKEQEIEKLKEYKATLINSAVTGKIKVELYG